MTRIILTLAGCVPIAVLMAATLFHRWRRRQLRTRLPVTEKLLRPAGYSLSLKLEDLSDNSSVYFFAAYLFSMVSVGAWRYSATDFTGELVGLGLFGLSAATCTVLAWRTLLRIRNLRLGRMGEWVMAELLQPLLAKGYQVFHDVPGSGSWNIDHVLVGPGGVFAVETKCRTKRPGAKGQPDYKASFDGNAIYFPRHTDRRTTGQALAGSKWLRDYLSKATGEKVHVQALVALPGWMVTLETNAGEVKVLSGKQVHGFVASEPNRLSDKAIKQVAFQLDRLCRDVGF